MVRYDTVRSNMLVNGHTGSAQKHHAVFTATTAGPLPAACRETLASVLEVATSRGRER